MKYFVSFSLILLAFAGGLLAGLRLGSKPPAEDRKIQGFAGDRIAPVENSGVRTAPPEAHEPGGPVKSFSQTTGGEGLTDPLDDPEHSSIPSHEMRGGRRIPLEAADAEDLIRAEDLKASLMESGTPEADIERMMQGRNRYQNPEDSGPGVEERSDEEMNLEDLREDFEESLRESGATPEEIEIMKEGFFRSIVPRSSRQHPSRGISQE